MTAAEIETLLKEVEEEVLEKKHFNKVVIDKNTHFKKKYDK